MMTKLDVLPPLSLMQKWREEGLSPEQIRQRADEVILTLKPRLRHTPKPPRQKPKSKLPDPAEVWQIYQEKTLIETGKHFGVTAERVRQVLKGAGYDTRLHISRPKPKPPEYPEMLRLRLEEGLNYSEIATRVGHSENWVWKHLGKVKKPAKFFKPLGCPDCERRPLARGLCRNCYARWLKRGKPEL